MNNDKHQIIMQMKGDSDIQQIPMENDIIQSPRILQTQQYQQQQHKQKQIDQMGFTPQKNGSPSEQETLSVMLSGQKSQIDQESLLLQDKQVQISLNHNFEMNNFGQNKQNHTIDQFNVDFQSQDQIPKKQIHPSKVIVLRNVHKTYLIGIEGVAALRGVDVQIEAGEFVSIFGTSGGGKTTLLNIMGTIDKPTKGDVYICGHKIKLASDDTLLAGLRLTYIGFVFQSFNLMSSLTAIENVELPMILKGGMTVMQIRERALELLTMVGLEQRISHYPSQLSGGEQQRVTIARALSNKPKILLLDEPTGDLDTKATDIIMNILIKLNQIQKITLVMVTHDLNLKNYANRVIRMMDGKILKTEIIDEIVRNNHIQTLNETIQFYNNENQQTDLGIRSGTQKHGDIKLQQIDKQNLTEIRSPQDYQVVTFAQKQKQAKQQ